MDKKRSARKKAQPEKTLSSMAGGRQLWLRNFAASVSFLGSDGEFIDRLVRYITLDPVSLNATCGAFHRLLGMPFRK